MRQPDSTAVVAALWRAAHLILDPPPHVLEDRIALQLAHRADLFLTAGFSVPDLAPPMVLNSERLSARRELLTQMDQYQRQAEATANHAGEKVVELRERLSTALESAKVTAQRLEEKTIEAAKATDRVVREHPYQSIGIAFGVGLLIGVLVARK